MKVTRRQVRERDLKVGDLFSNLSPEQWDQLAQTHECHCGKKHPIGIVVFLTVVAESEPENEELVYRLTLEKEATDVT